MGIHNRDDSREKHKGEAKSKFNDFENPIQRTKRADQKSTKKDSASLSYLLMPALMLSGLWYGADRVLKYKATQPAAQTSISILGLPAEPDTIQPVSGGLVLKADRQGHFRGTVLIDNVPMPFLIDTGATLTSIPANLANAARLPVGDQVNTHTAGGQVVDRLTQISSLKIGNAEIRNLEAAINQHLAEVLIGMNTLKYFNMNQTGNTMTLVVNGSIPQQIAPASAALRPNTTAAEQAEIQPVSKRPTTIKKKVSCDANHVCITIYSDH